MAIPAYGSSGTWKRVCRLALTVIAVVLLSLVASAESQLPVLATDLTSPAALGYWECFYLRIG